MLITDTESLRRFCETAGRSAQVFVDCEFVREKTYRATLCLVQVAAGGEAAAVDTLADGIDLAPLAALLQAPGVTKVFHSASQDLAILLERFGALPGPVWDTQVAAAFCGYGEQAAYASLAQRICGVEIDKAAQLTDWTRRPLTDAQLAYALADVVHLGPIHQHLVERLEALGRTAWATEEMVSLAERDRYEVDPREQWRRVKVRRPTARALAVLREIAAWREETARTRDLPRGWVLKDEALAEIALNRPRDRAALGRVRGIAQRLVDGADGDALLAAVARGVALPADECPRPPPPRQPTDGQETTVTLLSALLKTRCEEHTIAPSLVASRAELERLASGGVGESSDAGEVRALSGWRRTIFGEDAFALLEGRLALVMRGGGVATIAV